MKKFMMITLGVTSLLLLSSCGSSNNSTTASKMSHSSAAESVTGWNGSTLTTHNAKYKIIATKIILKGQLIPIGPDGNGGELTEPNDKDILAIWYDTTNISGVNNLTSLAFVTAINAVQDNNSNFINTLQVGGTPFINPNGSYNDTFSNSQMQNIKKDGTVAGVMAFDLTDTTTPVKLTSNDNFSGSYTIKLK